MDLVQVLTLIQNRAIDHNNSTDRECNLRFFFDQDLALYVSAAAECAVDNKDASLKRKQKSADKKLKRRKKSAVENKPQSLKNTKRKSTNVSSTTTTKDKKKKLNYSEHNRSDVKKTEKTKLGKKVVTE